MKIQKSVDIDEFELGEDDKLALAKHYIDDDHLLVDGYTAFIEDADYLHDFLDDVDENDPIRKTIHKMLAMLRNGTVDFIILTVYS